MSSINSALIERVYQANLLLVTYDLVTFTWGNVSEIDRESQLIVIKPSGVEYALMKPEDMVVVDLEGHVRQGSLKPSSDLDTHLELYRRFETIHAIVHTHSTYATSYAQAQFPIHCLGTTHADTFNGSVPCTRLMSRTEIKDHYELNTGKVIVETFQENGIDPAEMPGVLVASHGPFIWGKDAIKAVENAKILEEVARMNSITEGINPTVQAIQPDLLDKHFQRKHGKNAYYGQTK